MDGLSLFGLFAFTAMLVCYALEDAATGSFRRSRSLALGSAYGFCRALPFGGRGGLGRRGAAALAPQGSGASHSSSVRPAGKAGPAVAVQKHLCYYGGLNCRQSLI